MLVAILFPYEIIRTYATDENFRIPWNTWSESKEENSPRKMSDEPPVAVAVPAAAEDEGKEEDLTANEAGDAPNAGVTPAENQVCASPQLEHYLFVGAGKI